MQKTLFSLGNISDQRFGLSDTFLPRISVSLDRYDISDITGLSFLCSGIFGLIFFFSTE